MQIKTNIAKVVEEVSDKVKYDNEVKKVLSDPQILAWILKYTVREFESFSIKDIMGCIEGEPEVATHNVHSGHYTEPVEGLSTESAEVTVQKVTYDIRFRVRVPGSGTVGMIINVEAQNKFHESYDLVSRGIFYCARMLSTQVRNEEAAKEYNNLQKVYSIWICLQVPLNSEYTITGYHMNRQDIYGHMKSKANRRYDLMEMVMICLGRRKNAEKGTELHQLLTTVLSEELTPEEKIKVMKEEYDIVTSVELEGGLAKMCNLSDYIEEKGIEKGIEQGARGKLEEQVQKKIQKNKTIEQIADELEAEMEEIRPIYNRLLAKMV